MKKYIAFLLAFTIILSGCAPAYSEAAPTPSPSRAADNVEEAVPGAKDDADLAESFTGLNDPNLLQYVEDSVYSELVSEFSSEDYIVENVSATYISKEYLEELAYNSQANVFFGYTLAELDAQFQGTRYVFTLGDNGETIVKPFEGYDDTYEKVLKNVAIGTGVILVCVTVSVVTGGAGLAPVSMVFAASAKTATTFALSSSLIGGVSAGVIEGFQTKDFDAALKAAALGGSEGFKWGAISGALIGGATELSAIHRASSAVEGATEYAKGSIEIADDLPQWRQAELRALNETGGYEQLSYLNGQQVPFGTQGATRPDVVQFLGDHIEAIEVKYYNLESQASLGTLYSELEREVAARVANLPAGSTQRIILDVTGRGFTEATCNAVKTNIWSVLENIYPNIPIEIVGL
ncbi:MAG: hypothetical protein IKO83_04760 [Oscillospiraceae bacterium]|nr:hypothetical protein [Oscillospiraceae bacterium]